MTMRFEQGPGSEETLLALYDAVVAAEELDLEEQADFEALRRESEAADVDGSEPIDVVESVDEDRPTMSQAVGVIEHLLGGHRIASGDPGV
ncbi:MAG: hypothetical protein ACJ71Z_10335 [Aeromicrobium sp.]